MPVAVNGRSTVSFLQNNTGNQSIRIDSSCTGCELYLSIRMDLIIDYLISAGEVNAYLLARNFRKGEKTWANYLQTI